MSGKTCYTMPRGESFPRSKQMTSIFLGAMALYMPSATFAKAQEEILMPTTRTAQAAGSDLLDEEILDALAPEQVRAFAEGADPRDLILDSGQTLEDLIHHLFTKGLAEPELVYHPLQTCVLVRTVDSMAGALQPDATRDFIARGESSDLSNQGGSATGCGIPPEAKTLLANFIVVAPSTNGELKAWASDLPPGGSSLIRFSNSTEGIQFDNAAPINLCDSPGCASDFRVQSRFAVTHLRIDVMGYFSPKASGSTLDAIDGSPQNAVFVDEEGRVGVGNIAPTQSLDVNGAIRVGHTDQNINGSVRWNGSDLQVFTGTEWTSLTTVAWSDLLGIPIGFADNVDNTGITTESDPTVPANVKDGVAWPEIANIPAGFADGVDNVGSDNLGNHTATQNLRLNGHFLSNDGGSEGVFVNTTGQVGIGTNNPSPSHSLDIAGSVNTTGNYRIGGSLALALGSSSVFVGNAGNAGVDNVFIGAFAGNDVTTGPRNVYIGSDAGRRTTTGNGNVAIGEGAGDEGFSGSDNVYIGEDAGGGIGNTGSDNIFIGNKAGFNETGSDKLYIANSSTSTPLIHGDFNTSVLTIHGSLVVTGSCSGCSSDLALKQNISPIENSLEKITQLNGVAFDWTDESDESRLFPARQLGVIAQEVEQVFPELVGTDHRGYRFVRYEKLVAPLVEAVKALKARNEELKKLLCLDHPEAVLCRE